MKEVIQSLPKIKSALEYDDKLQSLIGDNIKYGITTKPRLNFSEINEKYGLYSYISISVNRIEGLQDADLVTFKVNIVTDLANDKDPASTALALSERVIKILTQKELIFGLPEQIEFGEMEETYFDLDQMTWGYVIILGISKQPV